MGSSTENIFQLKDVRASKQTTETIDFLTDKDDAKKKEELILSYLSNSLFKITPENRVGSMEELEGVTDREVAMSASGELKEIEQDLRSVDKRIGAMEQDVLKLKEKIYTLPSRWEFIGILGVFLAIIFWAYSANKDILYAKNEEINTKMNALIEKIDARDQVRDTKFQQLTDKIDANLSATRLENEKLKLEIKNYFLQGDIKKKETNPQKP